MQDHDTPEPTKQCIQCRETKPLREFHRKASRKDGYNNVCKNCRAANEGFRYRPPARDGYRRCKDCGGEFPATAEYFHTHKAGWLNSYCRSCAKARAKAHYHADPERHQAVTLAARRRNPEKYRAIARNWARRNRAKRHAYYLRTYARHLERCRNWYHRNIEYARELSRLRAREWFARNPDAVRAVVQRRLARKRRLPAAFCDNDWQAALNYFGGCCAVCGRPPGLFHTLAMDHWIPLSSSDCPGTVPANIVPLCHGTDGCNNSKNNRPARDWLISKFGPAKASRILARIEAYFASIM